MTCCLIFSMGSWASSLEAFGVYVFDMFGDFRFCFRYLVYRCVMFFSFSKAVLAHSSGFV